MTNLTNRQKLAILISVVLLSLFLEVISSGVKVLPVVLVVVFYRKEIKALIHQSIKRIR